MKKAKLMFSVYYFMGIFFGTRYFLSRITKLEGVEAVDVACNNGTTAVVTSAGDLLMFGKDAAGHTEPNTGLVAGVKDVSTIV